MSKNTIRLWAKRYLKFGPDVLLVDNIKRFLNEDPGKYGIKRKFSARKYSKEKLEEQQFTISVLNKIIKKMLRMN